MSSRNLNNKRVLIRADGSHSIGLGHVFRMLALARALRSDGANVRFVSKDDVVCNRMITDAGFHCVSCLGDSVDDVLENEISISDPHLLIFDVLKTNDTTLKMVRSNTDAKMVTFDDVGAGLQHAEAVINGIAFSWGVYERERCNAKVYEGPQYIVLGSGIESYLDKKREPRVDANRIMVAFGGSDTHGLTAQVLKALNGASKKLSIRINMGPAFDEGSLFVDAVMGSPHDIQLCRNTSDIYEEMMRSDLVICGGGIMLYELAALGIPSISVATEEHEELNLKYWSAIGTILPIGARTDISESKLVGCVIGLLNDSEARITMSECGRRTVDGKGLKRVVDIIDGVVE